MTIRKRFLVISLISIFFVAARGTVHAWQELISIESRPGVTIKFLLMSSDESSQNALIMLPGADGANHIVDSDGQIKLSKNFLVRTAPGFTKQGLSVVIVDAPSDQSSGMGDTFRVSQAHKEDIEKIISDLAGRNLKSIYIIGTSRGTISAAFLGSVLKDHRVKAIILTSTMRYEDYLLPWISLEKTPYPVLIVHSENDSCKSTPYFDAKRLKSKFPGSPKVEFISVKRSSYSQGDACGPMSPHGFLGNEQEVVQIIVNWINVL